jgi:hypothetical protein
MRTITLIVVVLAVSGAATAQDDVIAPDGSFTNGGASWAASENYSMQFSLGQTFIGTGATDVVQADAGFLYALWVTQPPEGWINAGWNWISLPAHAQFPQPSVIFEQGKDPRNRLYRWDWLFKSWELYPYDFAEMEKWTGYLLFTASLERPRYSGFLNRTPMDDPDAPDYRASTVYIPLWGGITLGYSHPWPLDLRAVKVRYGDEVRTATEDRADPEPWLNWNWVYWDSADDTAKICAFAGGDDTMLRPWHYYWVWFNVPKTPADPLGPYLIIPEPEFEFGGG